MAKFLQTPPLPVLSPDAKGGRLSERPTTSSRKTAVVMKTGKQPRNRTDPINKRLRQRQRITNIGTWNVLSWYRTGAATHTIQEIERIGMDITAIQEIRWPNNGDMKISKSHIFYSGNQQDKHEFGTGFVVKESIVHNIVTFTPVNERLCYIRLKNKPYNCSVISAHAPTEDKGDDVKEDFYEELESLIAQTPKQDMLLLCGDFNAQIGQEQAYRPTIGMHSLHRTSNDNGTRLIQLAASSNMVIKSTMFDHKNIHKQTWISNDGVTRNQIDHIVVDARHGSNVIDVRSLRGADADSDHILVRAKVRLRLSAQKIRSSETIRRWDTDKLKTAEISTSFQNKIRENILHLENEDNLNNIDNQWEKLKDAITNAAETCLGKKKKVKRKTWFDSECEDLIQQRIVARNTMLQNPSEENITYFKETRKLTTKAIRQKKRRTEQITLTEMELNRSQNKSREFFNDVTDIKRGFRPRTGNILKRNDNTLITNETEILTTWRDHFQKLLNTTNQNNENTTPCIYHTVDIPVEEPTLDEVIKAIQRQKNNKAPGSDNITSECLKHGGETLYHQLHTLIISIWQEEQLPKEWKDSVIIPLHKKGDKMKCSNYRGIALINTTYKVLSNILLDRMTPLVETSIGDYQSGFRKHKSTIDQIFTIRQMLEKAWEFNQSLHNLFIDFQQAYDSILRVELWKAMTEISVPQKLIRLTRICVEDTWSYVRLGKLMSEPFLVNNGLKQGDAMSPLLFNIALDKAVRAAELTMEMFTTDGPKLLLAFADDIDIIGKNIVSVKEQFCRLERETRKMGLRINEAKTKYMCVTRTPEGRRDRIGQNVSIGEFNFERANSFKYLGTTITEDNNTQEEIKIRILSGNKCIYALGKVLRTKHLSRKSKIQIYKTIIRPVVMYGCETWTMTKASELKLRCFERKVLRKIYGPILEVAVQRYRIRTNKELQELYKDPDIVQEIKSKRLRWAGHVIRQPEDRWINLVWQTNPQGRRPLGRPRLRWRDNIANDLRIMGYEIDTDLMRDRDGWRQIVQSAKTHIGL